MGYFGIIYFHIIDVTLQHMVSYWFLNFYLNLLLSYLYIYVHDRNFIQMQRCKYWVICMKLYKLFPFIHRVSCSLRWETARVVMFPPWNIFSRVRRAYSGGKECKKSRIGMKSLDSTKPTRSGHKLAVQRGWHVVT